MRLGWRVESGGVGFGVPWCAVDGGALGWQGAVGGRSILQLPMPVSWGGGWLWRGTEGVLVAYAAFGVAHD